MATVLIWLHVLAAVAWIGGMLFLSVVLAPLYRARRGNPDVAGLFRLAATRFRFVVWASAAVLVVTGPMLLQFRDLSFLDPASWPAVVAVKLALVTALLLLTAVHDLVLGPRVAASAAGGPGVRSPTDRLIFALSAWLPRVSLLLGVMVVCAAVVLART